MRVIVVGAGNQGGKRAKVAGPDFVATVDPFNTAATFRTVEQAPLDSYDAALVCTPDAAKPKILSHLLTNRKHVLVEKPLIGEAGTTLQQLKELAEHNEVVCYTAYNHRFEPHILRLKQALDANWLGRIYQAKFFYGNGTARDVRNSAWRDTGLGVLPDLGSRAATRFGLICSQRTAARTSTASANGARALTPSAAGCCRAAARGKPSRRCRKAARRGNSNTRTSRSSARTRRTISPMTSGSTLCSWNWEDSHRHDRIRRTIASRHQLQPRHRGERFRGGGLPSLGETRGGFGPRQVSHRRTRPPRTLHCESEPNAVHGERHGFVRLRTCLRRARREDRRRQPQRHRPVGRTHPADRAAPEAGQPASPVEPGQPRLHPQAARGPAPHQRSQPGDLPGRDAHLWSRG